MKRTLNDAQVTKVVKIESGETISRPSVPDFSMLYVNKGEISNPVRFFNVPSSALVMFHPGAFRPEVDTVVGELCRRVTPSTKPLFLVSQDSRFALYQWSQGKAQAGSVFYVEDITQSIRKVFLEGEKWETPWCWFVISEGKQIVAHGHTVQPPSLDLLLSWLK